MIYLTGKLNIDFSFLCDIIFIHQGVGIEMELTYKNDKLRNLCENPKYRHELIKKYGVEVANKLPLRINMLKAFDNLNDVPSSLPFRRHKLNGKYKDFFAINITQQYRLIFKQSDNNIIISDLKLIKDIKVMEVSKHYE